MRCRARPGCAAPLQQAVRTTFFQSWTGGVWRREEDATQAPAVQAAPAAAPANDADPAPKRPRPARQPAHEAGFRSCKEPAVVFLREVKPTGTKHLLTVKAEQELVAFLREYAQRNPDFRTAFSSRLNGVFKTA